MPCGFRPENWRAFQAELQKRDISAADIEMVEMRPTENPGAVLERGSSRDRPYKVTLRSGRAESWSQRREAIGDPPRRPRRFPTTTAAVQVAAQLS